MLDIKLIRENPEQVKANLLKRNFEVDFTELLSWDSERRELRIKMDQMKNERNVSAKKVPMMKKNGEDVTEELARMKKLSDEITEVEKHINELMRDGKIDGIASTRDESDENIHFIIDIKRDANANVVLNNLYKFTQMQETFGTIMIALVDKEPKILNLRQMIDAYIAHQEDVIRRRTSFDLSKAAVTPLLLLSPKAPKKWVKKIFKNLLNFT